MQAGAIELIEKSNDLVVMGHVGSVVNFVRNAQDGFVLNCHHAITSLKHHCQITEVDLVRAWFDNPKGLIEELAAPFSLCGRRHGREAFSVLTDRYGLAHTYGFQGKGVCAISSSALLLGRVFQQDIDLNAVGEFAHLGHYLGCATALKNVRKSAPGHSLDMHRGRLSSTLIFPNIAVENVDTTGYTRDGEDILRESVQVYVDAYPKCNIELSGGVDSRLILAGVPKSQRKNHLAVTLGAKNSADVKIASQIANQNGMQHKIIDIGCSETDDPDCMIEQLHQASLRHDHAVNPIDKLAIERVRSKIGYEPRLSGQNGEIARGFYYPGQPLDGSFKPGDFNRLVQWRLMGGDTANRSVFNGVFLNEARSSLSANAFSLLQPTESWPLSLDRFYLEQRMQRWCGSAVSAACSERAIMMPFFNPQFVEWSMMSPAREKAGSRLACSLICRLDPELASLPFDSGATPLQLTRSGVGRKASDAFNLGRKSAKRLFERATGKSRHNLGTRSITELLERGGIASKLDWNLMHSTGIFDHEYAEKLATGRLTNDRATLGFLTALDYTMKYLKKPVVAGPIKIIERHSQP